MDAVPTLEPERENSTQGKICAQFGHYRVEDPIGAGGMGEVYRAVDTRLGRTVALKVMRPEMAEQADFRERFAREARTISALNHPHICTLYDLGEQDGVAYLVMEYVEGETLAARLRQGPLPLDLVLRYGAEAASALAAAHARGIIHRDLKPANLMVTPFGIKLLDFGLAKFTLPKVIPAPALKENLTQSLMIMGTLAYMSPEQCRGEVLDGRSDVFALGCVLYEAATGVAPFRGASLFALLDEIAAAVPVAPSSLRSELPKELDAVFARALAKNREQRYASAFDFGQALSDLRTTGAVRGADLRRLKRAREPDQRTSFQSAGAAVPAAPRRKKETKAIGSLAVLPFFNSSGDPEMEYLSEGIADSLANTFSEIRKLRVAPRSLAFRYRGKEIDPQAAGRELGVRAVLTGRVCLRGKILLVGTELLDIANMSQIWGAQYRRKFDDILAVQEEIALEISSKLRLQLSPEEKKRLAKHPAQDKETYELYLKAVYFFNLWSEENLKRAIEYARQAIQRDPACALAYSVQAAAYSMVGFYGFLPPTEAFPKAKAGALRAIELDERLPEAHTSLALTQLFYEWDWAGGGRACRRALELNPDNSFALQVQDAYFISQNGLRDALAAARRAVELDPLSSSKHFIVGLAHFCSGQLDAAIAKFRETVELDPHAFSAQELMTCSYAFQGRYEEAQAACQKLSGLPGESGASRAILAYIHAVSGDSEKARIILEEISDLLGKDPLALFYAPMVCAALGEFDRSFELLNKLCDIRFGPLFTLRGAPMLDPLRSDPRFQDLLRRMGLPE